MVILSRTPDGNAAAALAGDVGQGAARVQGPVPSDPGEHRQHVMRRNGDVLPTVLLEGLVRGVWRATADAIEVRAFEPLNDATLAELDHEARHLRRLLADREPTVFSRFGRWWDRLPDGPTITTGS